MPAERSAGARRARGSRAPRIAGIGVVLLLAGTGIIANLVAAKPQVTVRHVALPGKVESVQEVGLVSAGPPAAANMAAAPAQTLLKLPSGLAFVSARQAVPEWTADQLAGGTYVFIYISDGMCLASADGQVAGGRVTGGRVTAVVRRCNLGYAQRWLRQDADTRGYWQLRNAADSRCLTLANAVPAGGQNAFRADLAPCGAQQDWRQRFTFSPIY
jgi:Ricin-type beta-trefoil lectin domain-like